MQHRPPPAPPEAYIDPAWFEREQNLLFRKLWQFFTFASMVDEPNKFVTKIIAGIPVVVQNFDGELRAFENVCLHRQSPLQPEACGKRALTCPYHGWNYDANGCVKAIPFEEYYQFAPKQKDDMRLRSFALKKIGALVFINLDSDPIPLEKQFSAEYLASLAEVTHSFDHEMVITQLPARRFNWKLIFENLRDGLHPTFLHRESLNKIVTFRPWMPAEQAWDDFFKNQERDPSDPFEEVRTYFSKGGPDAPLDRLDLQPWHDKIERYRPQDNSYFNWLTFPTMHIASTGGLSFVLEHYMPRSADMTDVEVYCFLARRKDELPNAQTILAELVESTIKILTEDFNMIEKIQSGMHKDMPPANWGGFELRSYRIATWMTKVVRGEIKI